jgi:hypothetical protein
MDTNIDYVAVVVAALVYMLIGWGWYSKFLFGEVWSRESGVSAAAMKKKGQAPILYGFINALVLALFLERFLTWLQVTTVSDGIFIGGCVWLGFIGTTLAGSVIWGDWSLKRFVIEAGCMLVTAVSMAGVIAA